MRMPTLFSRLSRDDSACQNITESSLSLADYLVIVEYQKRFPQNVRELMQPTSPSRGRSRVNGPNAGHQRYDTNNLLEILQHSEDDFQRTLAQFQWSMPEMPTTRPRSVSPATVTTDRNAPPSAATDAITELPHARILPVHRELFAHDTSVCGVCCDRLIDGVALMRLPCGHIYHVNCAVSWLGRSCTCPECRYEIATSSRKYEVGRTERMKTRKVVKCSCQGTHSCFFSDNNKSLLDQCMEVTKN